jgi:phosphoribosylaminoimidazole-succinocarboxamide synthase
VLSLGRIGRTLGGTVTTADNGSGLTLLHSGKVRDVYDAGDGELLLVASDRISVYDVVLPTPVPDKGAILTQLSLWWFDQLADVVPNHVVSTDVPAEFAGRAIRVKRLKMVEVECIARGYITGGGLTQYQETGTVSGVALPPGLVEASKLATPIFTPTTKESVGTHDQPMTYAEVEAQVGADVADDLRRITLEVYWRGARIAAERGVIVADTKIELGWSAEGELTLGDEVLTPDSSRFWPADEYKAGQVQRSYDKQFVRDWAAGTGWDKRAPGPEVPDDVIEATRARYVEVYERLTGRRWG